ncbi:MAG: hypothetical protein COA33_008920 [Fluviicola sp.]|nr:hypothetical protein [Fluviicola sp.]
MMDKFKMECKGLEKDLCIKYLVEKWSMYDNKAIQEFWIHSPRETAKKKRHSISVEIHKEGDEQKLIIRGNLRKWYFGKNNLADLDWFKFNSALNELSRRIFGGKDKIWGMTFTQLELGFNFQLLNSAKGIIDSFVAFSTFRRILYEHETAKFEGAGYSVTIYDKLKEIIEDKESYFKHTKPVFAGLRKLHTKAVLPRFEVQITKMTKAPEFNRLCKTPFDLRENFDEVFDLVHQKFNDMTYLDSMAPDVVRNLSGKGKREITEYFIYMGVKAIGEIQSLSIVNGVNRDKADFRNYIETIYERQNTMPRMDIKKDVKKAVSKRVRKLKCNDRLESI